MEDPRKARVKETVYSHQLLAMPLPVPSTRIPGTGNQNQEDVPVRLHLLDRGMMFRCLHETKDAEVTSIHVLPQQIVSSDSQSRTVTSRCEDLGGIQGFHLELKRRHRAQRTDLPVEGVISVESWDATRIFIRPIDLHHHDEVRHHRLCWQELTWMIHCLNMFETCLFHGEVITDVSGVNMPIVLLVCIIRLYHPGLRKIHRPLQWLRQVRQTCHGAQIRVIRPR